MAKVFVVNNGGHDYTDAMQYGTVVFCTTGVIDRTDTSTMFRELSDALANANPDDYLLITSLCSLCCIATGILADRFGKINFLMYDCGKYNVRTVTFESWYEGV